jgi:hypothetical protein
MMGVAIIALCGIAAGVLTVVERRKLNLIKVLIAKTN